ncbi:MAG: hypothetical protein K2N01_09305 [Lachnospiraceae bacterium]|nr:hypothetical protein [Lachnospiraceae bacterium]
MKQDFKTVMQCILLLFGIVICMLVCDFDRIHGNKISIHRKCFLPQIEMKEKKSRFYQLNDESLWMIYEDLSGEIELETWGKVWLVNGVFRARHPYPAAFLTDENRNVLYYLGSFTNGFDIVEYTVADKNEDGLKDIEWILALGDNVHLRYRAYQGTDGEFGGWDVVCMEEEGMVYEAK